MTGVFVSLPDEIYDSYREICRKKDKRYSAITRELIFKFVEENKHLLENDKEDSNKEISYFPLTRGNVISLDDVNNKEKS